VDRTCLFFKVAEWDEGGSGGGGGAGIGEFFISMNSLTRHDRLARASRATPVAPPFRTDSYFTFEMVYHRYETSPISIPIFFLQFHKSQKLLSK